MTHTISIIALVVAIFAVGLSIYTLFRVIKNDR